ncbi:MAG TPA: FAD-binding protein, partial [Thermoleophilia bacterium]|nr:FAD-binding protein [Thermoleophilia bacterium]
MTSDLTSELAGIPGSRSWRRAPLAPFTTIGVGGNADLLVTVDTADALIAAVRLLSDADVPWVVLGGGSNFLVPDSGYRGVVLKLDHHFHYVEEPEDADASSAWLVAGAGLPLSRLAVHVADLGLSGLEFACGIPGSVGGGVCMNAGAHSGCMADVVDAVHIVSGEGLG